MTTRQKLESMLSDYGIFESQAIKILDYAIPKLDAETDEIKVSRITWNLPAEDYPHIIFNIIFGMLKKYVAEWAEINIPLAWWIPIFKTEQSEII